MDLIFPTSITTFQIIWVSIFILISQDIYKRTKRRVKPEWNEDYSKHHTFKKGVRTALAKMYTNILSKNAYELAETVAVEMCRDAGIYYNTSIFYFLHLRQKPKELQKYFTDRELILFLFKPDVWVTKVLQEEKGFGIGFRKNKEVTSKFIFQLDKIVDAFRAELINKDRKTL